MLLFLSLCFLLDFVTGSALPVRAQNNGRDVSLAVYESLEELARIVDISYCVGTTGVHKPFACLSRCKDFEGFELVTTWNTGPLFSDSCGYIALSHSPHEKRVIVAFRGTYSIANTIADLSTVPAVYEPYPADGNQGGNCQERHELQSGPLLPQLFKQTPKRSAKDVCQNCTVHSGFATSWLNTRCTIIPHVERALEEHPDYKLTLVGHSLGGAVAALAALEFQARGWTPQVTTFGEPRIGNKQLSAYIDRKFNLNSTSPDDALYRRVTHVGDPVPLLPLEEWGYTMHAGEIFISKSSLPPALSDLEHCEGDEDPMCIEDKQPAQIASTIGPGVKEPRLVEGKWSIPARYKLWELFFAHRDYFWRLGLCMPGGDPWKWATSAYELDTTADE